MPVHTDLKARTLTPGPQIRPGVFGSQRKEDRTVEVVGRFAPSPSGRMHLGNLLAALLAWLDARSAGGRLILRIEDLDPDRCDRGRAAQIIDDLRWLGLDWDEGGLEPDWCQSRRSGYYAAAFEKLNEMGLVYPCYCTRAERLAASAPHGGEGEPVYSGKCANLTGEERLAFERAGRRPAWRVRVPDATLSVNDGHYGLYTQNLRRDCGDFIVRRSDGVWAYQLAAAVDDVLMGVTRVVRGRDLLPSAPRQAWLCRTLGHEPPEYCHLPLLADQAGRRLSKRDRDLDMGTLRTRYAPEELTGLLGWYAGLLEKPKSVEPKDLLPAFSWAKVPKNDIAVGCP